MAAAAGTPSVHDVVRMAGERAALAAQTATARIRGSAAASEREGRESGVNNPGAESPLISQSIHRQHPRPARQPTPAYASREAREEEGLL